MKECTNDYFEEDIPEDDLTDALERENAAILEIELEMENEPEVSKIPEASTRKKLKRELEQEALARLEDSARTEEDFENVVTWWNRLDANRERKERYHEIGRSDVPLEWGMSPDEIVIPAPIRHVFWKQIMKGDFLDAIYDCPFEMHELVTDEDISQNQAEGAGAGAGVWFGIGHSIEIRYEASLHQDEAYRHKADEHHQAIAYDAAGLDLLYHAL